MFLASPLRVAASQSVAAAENSTATAAADALLAKPINVSLDRVSLGEAIDALAATGRITVTYRRETINTVTKTVTLISPSITLGDAFAAILSGTPLRLVALPGAQFGIARTAAPAPGGTITGSVIDAHTKQPIQNARVTLDATDKGVTTDSHGEFRITNVAAGHHALVVRAVGYSRQTRQADVSEDATVTVAVALTASANQLDQVVVTGTVIPTELKAVPNAITVITAKDIEQRGITQIQQLFRGDVPGVYASNMGDNQAISPGVSQMASRGSTNLTYPLTQSIKTYVDGVELANSTYMGLIDPKSIERIEILTGPQASTLYGSNAINGVMQIFTKRGSTPHPQFTASLQTGFIQNNFSSSLAPQHDDMAQVSGVEGHVSYNIGGSWVYIGPWTPSMHYSTLSGFGGVRFQQGPFSTDVSLRRLQTTNRADSYFQSYNEGVATGQYRNNIISSVTASRSTSSDQTLSLSATYSPVHWWSHTVTVGSDILTQGSMSVRPTYNDPTDTLNSYSNAPSNRLTLSYSSTAQIPLTSYVRAIVTGGADGMNFTSTTDALSGTSSITTLPTYTYISHAIEHNRGAYLQSQIAVMDALFLTYGLRAEWNPNFGANIRPNYAPRYGAAYTHSFGSLTTKLRASYGHSTRPPEAGLSLPITYVQQYGAGNTGSWAPEALIQKGNPDLVPEQQQGSEGGIELYLDNRASLIVTRYNQTVNNLIKGANVDSVAAIVPYTDFGYPPGYFPQWPGGYMYSSISQNLNLGNVRNQGWELQGTITTGPLTTKGTYSWTKSRIIGITPKYAKAFPQYKRGAPFPGAPEHTWALATTYGMSGTSVSLNIQGQGFLYAYVPFATPTGLAITRTRLMNEMPRKTLPSVRWAIDPAYAMADLNATHRITTQVDALLQVQNLTNLYRNDQDAQRADIGRQTKFGVRVRF